MVPWRGSQHEVPQGPGVRSGHKQGLRDGLLGISLPSLLAEAGTSALLVSPENQKFIMKPQG